MVEFLKFPISSTANPTRRFIMTILPKHKNRTDMRWRNISVVFKCCFSLIRFSLSRKFDSKSSSPINIARIFRIEVQTLANAGVLGASEHRNLMKKP